MSANVLFFGWGAPHIGRESMAGDLFGEFVAYLGEQQKGGNIHSFEPVFLDPHGGELNGFFVIRGDSDKLDKLAGSREWTTYITRGSLCLNSIGVVRGASGELLMERMATWRSLIPG